MELLTLIPLSIWDPFIAFGSAIMQPLYWVVSGILVLAYDIFAPVFGADSTQHAATAAQGARVAEETWS